MRILTFFLFSFILNSISAQFSLNLGGGANAGLGKFTPDLGDTKPFIGGYFSLGPSLKFKDKFIVNTEFQLQAHGFQAKEVTSKYMIYYIRAVPHFEFKIWKTLFINTGVDIGRRLNERGKGPSGGWQKYRNDIKLFEDWDFGITAGVKYYFGPIYLNMRYTFGMNKVMNITWVGLDDDGNVEMGPLYKKNNNLQLGIGVMINKQSIKHQSGLHH